MLEKNGQLPIFYLLMNPRRVRLFLFSDSLILVLA